jgi:3'-phosphoadenosine 5'-phosphosulfate sulfotransferase (PAPS reductase)/FAD synthetase
MAHFEAADLIGQAIKKHGKRIGITWSGGRDSTVVVHMAIQIKPDIPILFANTGCMDGETWAYVRNVSKLWDLNLHTAYPEKTFWQCVKEYGLPKVRNSDSKARTPKCCKILKEDPLDKLKLKLGINAYFTGLMKTESHQRFMTLSRYDSGGGERDEVSFCSQRYYKKTTNEWVYHPIAEWKPEDVSNYFIENNLPVNQIYVKWNGLYKRSGCLPCTAYLSWEKKLPISHPHLYQRLKEIERQENLNGCGVKI